MQVFLFLGIFGCVVYVELLIYKNVLGFVCEQELKYIQISETMAQNLINKIDNTVLNDDTDLVEYLQSIKQIDTMKKDLGEMYEQTKKWEKIVGKINSPTANRLILYLRTFGII